MMCKLLHIIFNKNVAATSNRGKGYPVAQRDIFVCDVGREQ